MSWTDERVALLKKMWGEGRTAAEIAKELGGVTRNAVIGKAHRLKLSNRVSPIQQNSREAENENLSALNRIRKQAKVANDTGSAAVAVAAAPRRITGVPLSELKDKMCRWPLGDPKEENFRFCGDQAAAGLPYCCEHAKVAYQATSRSRTLQAEDFEERYNNREQEDDLKEVVAVG